MSAAEDRNDLAYWLPRLQASGVPVPETRVVRTEVELANLLDGKLPEGFTEFIAGLRGAAEAVGGPPCFLRTGHGSGKHQWGRTCHVADLDALPQHVAALVEWSETVDFFGLPFRTWAVREMLDMRPAFRAFGGTPVGRERRYFFGNGEVLCAHPYWPAAAVEDADRPDWLKQLTALNEMPPTERRRLHLLTERVARNFDGAWSLDWLYVPGRDKWFAIDMAEASRSFHWPGCPHNMTPPQPPTRAFDPDMLRRKGEQAKRFPDGT